MAKVERVTVPVRVEVEYVQKPIRRVVEAPFPLEDGGLAWIRYPLGGWSMRDVDRLSSFVRAFVVPTGKE